jgi:hypothetical protein
MQHQPLMEYSRSPDGIDVKSPAEVFFYKCLDPRSSATITAVAQANDNPITGIHIAVLDIHNDSLLKRSLVALLVESDAQ